MKFPALIPLACIVLLALSLAVAGCISSSTGDKAVPPVSPAITSAGSPYGSSCGFTSCHGLDLACGTNVPDVCTMEYRLGDKCRQYARCDSGGGSCTFVTDPQFATCKACVKECESRTGTDPVSAFECESKC